MAVDAGRVDVDPRIALRELLHPGDLIGQRVVAHVAVVGLVERLRSPRRAHAVDLDDDEAELGERLRVAARRREAAAADAAGLRPGIDVVDDRILLRRIEVRRHVHQAVEIGLAVARLDRDRRRRLPPVASELRDVGLLERRRSACRSRRAARRPAARRASNSCRRSTRPDGESAIVVVRVFRREQRRASCRRCRCGRSA